MHRQDMYKEKSIEDYFLEFYHAQVVNVARRTASYAQPRYFTDPTDANVIKDSRDFYYQEYQDRYMETRVEYDRMAVVEIPQRALTTLARTHQQFSSGAGPGGSRVAMDVLNKEWEEKLIRETNPAVQLAWEQYSLLLHLASNGKTVG